MYHPTTFDDLRKRVDRERDALTAAALLPRLTRDEALAVIRFADTRAPEYKNRPDATREFRRRVPTVGGESNLRRVTKIKTTYKANDHKIPYRYKVRPTPHGIKSYTLGSDNIDLLCPTDGEYNWDTPQTLLSDFGGRSPILETIDVYPDTDFDRRPLTPV